MAYSVDDIRAIMKRAPRLSEAQPVKPGAELPEHYLTASTLDEYHALGRAFLAAARQRDPMWANVMDLKIGHEQQHAHAITRLGGLAVYTLAVYKPRGLIERRYPHQLGTKAGGLDHESPEFIVTTAYPEHLSRDDKVYLSRRDLTIADADRIAVEHGWHDLRPLSRQQGQQK